MINKKKVYSAAILAVIFGVSLLSFTSFVLINDICARPVKKNKIISSTPKSITGIVQSVTPTTISVLYREEKGIDYEIVVYIDANTKILRKKSLSELEFGDEVRIDYSETLEENEAKRQKKYRKADSISFIRGKFKGLRSQ